MCTGTREGQRGGICGGKITGCVVRLRPGAAPPGRVTKERLEGGSGSTEKGFEYAVRRPTEVNASWKQPDDFSMERSEYSAVPPLTVTTFAVPPLRT